MKKKSVYFLRQLVLQPSAKIKKNLKLRTALRAACPASMSGTSRIRHDLSRALILHDFMCIGWLLDHFREQLYREVHTIRTVFNLKFWEAVQEFHFK